LRFFYAFDLSCQTFVRAGFREVELARLMVQGWPFKQTEL